jgi:hypothetical protein
VPGDIDDVEHMALEAVRSLVGLQVMIEREPEHAAQAEAAVDLATRQMVEMGMLDEMITRAARQMTAD